MFFLLAACATTPTPEKTAAPLRRDPDAKVRSYAQDVARICEEREPQLLTLEKRCESPGRATEAVVMTMTLVLGGEMGRPAERCELVEAPSEEPIDPKLQAILTATDQANSARYRYEAETNVRTRRDWTLALGDLHQLCLEVPQ